MSAQIEIDERRRRVLDSVAIEMSGATPAEHRAMDIFAADECAESETFDAKDVPAFVRKYLSRIEKLVNIPAPELRFGRAK